MTDLEKIFNDNRGKQINKWNHYFEIYDRHFSKFRNKEITLVEIGVFQGGSLEMWKSYFGPQARIYGIDINPECKNLEEDNITIFIGSQADRKFLRDIKNKIPQIDILIDDGGHTMSQQIITFEELYDHVKPDGIYLCEDLHTSYWLEYGGGYNRRGTFIEYSKGLIDQLNAFHSEQGRFKPTPFTKSAQSMHFYDSILVIEKAQRSRPKQISNGQIVIENPEREIIQSTITWKLKHGILYTLNYILRVLNIRGIRWY